MVFCQYLDHFFCKNIKTFQSENFFYIHGWKALDVGLYVCDSMIYKMLQIYETRATQMKAISQSAS